MHYQPNGSNVWCLDLWGKKSGPFLQALHFAFALGTFVSPLMAEPFLSPSPHKCDGNTTENLDDSLDLLNDNITLNLSSSLSSINSQCYTLQEMDSEDRPPTIAYVYGIIGCYTSVVSLCFLVLFVIEPKEQNVKEEEEHIQQLGLKSAITVIFLVSVFIFLKCGVENAFAQLLTTFAVISNLKLTKSTGSFMTSFFWGAFTFGRGISIFLANSLSPSCMIAADLALMIIASSLLTFFGNTLQTCLWIGSGILGIGLASIFASTTMWLKEYVVVTNTIASILAGAAAIGQMTLPPLVGHFIEHISMILMYSILVFSCLGCIFFLAAWWIAKCCSKHTCTINCESMKI